MLRTTITHPGRWKLDTVDTVLALEDLGNVLMDTGRFEEAQRYFRDAAEILPNRSPSETGIAEVLLRQGIFPQNALTHAQTALNLFRSGTERISDGWRLGAILATKAWALAACGREAEAREAIDGALKSQAQKTKGPLAQAHYKAGMALLMLSDHCRAREHFARGIELDPAGRPVGTAVRKRSEAGRRLTRGAYCTAGRPDATGGLPDAAGADGGLFRQVG
jgi:tetratricopeptide (TPR) repeat protein